MALFHFIYLQEVNESGKQVTFYKNVEIESAEFEIIFKLGNNHAKE